MKRIVKLSLLLVLLVLGTFVFIQCQKEEVVKQQDTNQVKEQYKPKNIPVGVWVSGRLHRGGRWSEAHGVEPCTQSLGVCDVHGGVFIGPFTIGLFKTTYSPDSIPFWIAPDERHTGIVNGIIAFGAEPPDMDRIFYTAEEDPFIFPKEVSDAIGVNSLILLPGDYEVKFSDKYVYGYVNVKFKIN